MITKNYLNSKDGDSKNSFNIGIDVNPLVEKSASQQWVVMWNVAPSIRLTVKVSNGAVASLGTNTP